MAIGQSPVAHGSQIRADCGRTPSAFPSHAQALPPPDSTRKPLDRANEAHRRMGGGCAGRSGGRDLAGGGRLHGLTDGPQTPPPHPKCMHDFLSSASVPTVAAGVHCAARPLPFCAFACLSTPPLRARASPLPASCCWKVAWEVRIHPMSAGWCEMVCAARSKVWEVRPPQIGLVAPPRNPFSENIFSMAKII